MAARAVIRFAAILVAATTIVAVPASAQTNDPNAGRADCTDAAGAAAADCPKDGNEANVGGEPGAVTLPALIVDLFPNPP
ncbi:peptidase S8, partial [Mesorhizobium sp. M1121]